MSEKIKTLEERLEQLILQKNFSSLSRAEKEYVLNRMSREEYEKYQIILKQSKALFKQNQTQVDPRLKKELLHAFNTKPSGTTLSNPLVKIAQYPIPIWKLAIAASFLFLINQFFTTTPAISPLPPEIVYVHTTDTIYKEKTVAKLVDNKLPRQGKIKKNKKKRTSKKINFATNLTKPSSKQKTLLTPTTSLVMDTSQVQDLLTDLKKVSSNGRSAADEEALMDLFVEIN